MPPEHRQTMEDKGASLEKVAARIADEQPINWGELSETDSASLTGLREIEQLAQGFRHLQVSAVAPKTPISNRFKFGTLQVLEPIGSGAQGEVWRAYDPLLDLQVALKLRKVDSDSLSHQFLEEARRLARVRQANIVSVYGAAVHDGRAGLWTELVRGAPLSELLAQHGSFPAEEVRGVGLDLCHALAAVHRHGLVHGDVKAENVMREVSGRIVLMDFGTAREFELADLTVVSGTLRYLAPEVLRGASPSPASDIYALGILLFRLMSGNFPYAAGDLDGLITAQDRGERLRLNKMKSGFPADLVRAIESAIELDRSKRPASALAFAAALAPQPVAAAPRFNWKLAALIAAGAALAVSALSLWRGNAAAAWDANAAFYRVDKNAAVALNDGATIALGDHIALKFRSNRTSYVYIFDDDGSGQAAVQFPLPNMEPTNPLKAYIEHQLPGSRAGRALTWEVSSAAERERFVIIAADEPQPLLERTIAPWHHAGETGSTRGALGLATAPNEVGLPSAALQLELDRLAHDTAHVKRWNFVFPHGATR
jgi:eukaryotic-like serine/threonine-protein kinase